MVEQDTCGSQRQQTLLIFAMKLEQENRYISFTQFAAGANASE
jgi:hypothetical protein